MSVHGITIVQTPARISFFGGGTDVPEYFANSEGAVIGTTINKYTYVTLNSLDRLLGHRFRISYSRLESVDSIEEIEHNIVRGALSRHSDSFENSFVDIHSYADLPAGTGIGSSSSFTVGLLNAMYSLNGIHKSPKSLAEEAIQLERHDLKEAGGWQDQVFAAYGGFNKIRFNQEGFSVEPIVMPTEHIRALESSCMFIFTKVQRSSAKLQKEVMSETNIASKRDRLESIYGMVGRAEDILYNSKSGEDLVEGIGTLLGQSWEEKKRLSNVVSTPEIDDLYSKACTAGAYGGKLCGAGGGGFLLMIAPPEKHASIKAACSDATFVDFRFHTLGGSQVIFLRNI
jgi:D-glycero-alpha-D-manno-heptose-7-phosphate kinase